MLKELLRNTILEKFPQAQLDSTAQGSSLLTVPKDHLYKVAEKLKEDRSLDFDFLSCISGVDYLEYIELVYHLYSYNKKHFLVLKTSVSREDPEVVSLCPLWATADWQEREVYDLFGVIFSGHPNLKRILLPEDFPGYPFRRDYPLENNEEYLLKD